MLNVELDKIIPLTEARDSLSKIIAEVENEEEMYVLTKGGKPSVAIVSIPYLESLTGEKVEDKIREARPENIEEENQLTEQPDQRFPQEERSIDLPDESYAEIPAQMPKEEVDLTEKLENGSVPIPEIKEEKMPEEAPSAVETNPIPAPEAPAAITSSVPANESQTQNSSEQPGRNKPEPDDMEIG